MGLFPAFSDMGNLANSLTLVRPWMLLSPIVPGEVSTYLRPNYLIVQEHLCDPSWPRPKQISLLGVGPSKIGRALSIEKHSVEQYQAGLELSCVAVLVGLCRLW